MKTNVFLQKYKGAAVAITLIAVVLGLWIYFAPNGMGRYLGVRGEIRRTAAEIEDLRAENRKIEQEIGKIKNDRRYLEDVARRDYGLLRKNEMVFDFSKPEKKK